MSARERTENNARRAQIVAVAMRQFAELGYRGARVEDIAAEVGVAKGTVFLHFGNKEGLFLAVYREAVGQLPAWLDAPAEVVDAGFWSVLDYWLRSTEEFLTEQWVANRVAMIGRYDTGLGLRRPIDRLMRSEDPYGTLEFVEFGVRRGEIRDDVDVEMIASMAARTWTPGWSTASPTSPSGATRGSASSSSCCDRASHRHRAGSRNPPPSRPEGR
jgi:AcrR family transcriptional regulator